MKDQVVELMRAFVDGRDRSIGTAGAIEVALDEAYGEEEPFASVVLSLASYRPEGGEYLHGEADMTLIVAAALAVLEEEPPRDSR